MELNIILLPGDGVGPEVVSAAVDVLEAAGDRFGFQLKTREYKIGGCAIDEFGTALPDETRDACQRSDAVLLGAVGGPKWDDPRAAVRPEQGLLGLRKELGLFANLRPVRSMPDLTGASPIRPDKLEGVDLVVVRELTGGIYFGKPRERTSVNGEIQAVDTMLYSESEIRRVAHLAFGLARERRKALTSVDKANVLECSRLWREVVAQVALAYPDVTLENHLVDAAAMYLINQPASYDVILTGNMFGDILTDEASMLAGSMGLLPSASLGDARNAFGFPLGMYEPIHGSAPDIAGKNIANPVGTILSAAMMLRLSFGLEAEARAVESAVEQAITDGVRTVDIAEGNESVSSTTEFAQFVIRNIGST